MKFSRFSIIVASVLTIYNCFASTNSFAKEKMQFQFALYSKGLKIAQVYYVLSIDGDKYTATRKTNTVGIASWFSDRKLIESVEGNITENKIQPVIYKTKSAGSVKHDVEAKWDEKRKLILSFKNGFKLPNETVKEIEAAIENTQEEEDFDIIEEVSEQFIFSFVDAEKVCNGKKRIFSGKRIFDHQYQSLGYFKLKPSRTRAYEGNGFICRRVKIKVAGYGKDNGTVDQKVGNSKIWIGEINMDGKNVRIVVQMELQTKFLGKVIGYLTEMKKVPTS